ncbi:MAG: phosphoribosyl-ATP diphosphatase [Acetobacteraceae bacterium]
MAKSVKKKPTKRTRAKPGKERKPKKVLAKRRTTRTRAAPEAAAEPARPSAPLALGPGSAVLDRLFAVVTERRAADPAISHSSRLLSRGITKVAQKFGEESVECLIEAVAGNRDAVIAESADVLYHLIVLWVASGVHPEQVWLELKRREGVSGIAEKASRARALPIAFGLETTKIP